MLEQIRQFAFPLNVYAYILNRGEQPLEYLHYGLFGPGRNELAQAQAHSTRLVLERLPAPPARILEVGIGLGTTLSRLVQLGYDATGITPDANQLRFAHERYGVGSRIVCSNWETFQAGSGAYDAVLFQESAQYIATQDIFFKAHDFLAASGTLLILDEVALRRDEPAEQGLHPLDELLSVAQGQGFALEERLDLSAQAAPTVDHMLLLTQKYREGIQQDLGVSAEQIDSLDRSNESYRQKYGDGRFGYALLRFRKTAGATR